jgi:hypothetical protein
MAFSIESSQAWRGIVCEHCHYPMNRVPPHTGLSPRQRAERTTTCLIASEPASLLGRASALPRVPRLRTMPFCSGGLRCCHVPRSSGPRLPAQEGCGTATCPAAPDPASLLRGAPTMSRAPRLWTSLSSSGGLRCCHVPRGSLQAVSLRNKERLS